MNSTDACELLRYFLIEWVGNSVDRRSGYTSSFREEALLDKLGGAKALVTVDRKLCENVMSGDPPAFSAKSYDSNTKLTFRCFLGQNNPSNTFLHLYANHKCYTYKHFTSEAVLTLDGWADSNQRDHHRRDVK